MGWRATQHTALMPPTLLVVATTSWPVLSHLARAFAQFGWRIEIMAPSDAEVGCSPSVDRVHGYRALPPLRSLECAVRRSAATLILPCDDRAVAQLVTLHDRACVIGDRILAEPIARTLGAPAGYATLMNRAAVIAAAAAEGIAVPASRSIADRDELLQGLAEFGLPCVLKVDGSWGGDGVAIVHTRDEALAAFDRLSRRVSLPRALARVLRRRDAHHLLSAFKPLPPRLSLQAYVRGEPATMAFACWQGEVLAGLQADVVAGVGTTGPSSVLRLIEDEAMAAAARGLARRFGLSGLHGLDFVRDRDGKVHLLEVNPRATPICTLAMGEGRDLLAALATRATAQPVPARRPAITTDLVALFPQEWRRDPTSTWLRIAHHDVPWDDPALLVAQLGRQRSLRLLPRKAASGAEAQRARLPGNRRITAAKP